MIAPGPTEIINGLVDPVCILVWAIGVVTECGARASGCNYKTRDGDLRSSPGERREISRNSGKVQLRHDVPGIGKDSRLQVVEGVEAEPEFIDRRSRKHPRIRCHRLVHMRLHLASIKEKRRRLAFTAPTVSAEPTGLRGLREVDALNELVLVGLAVRGRLVVVRNQIRIKIRWRVKFEKLL